MVEKPSQNTGSLDTKKYQLVLVYEPVQAFTLIRQPPGANFGIFTNTEQIAKILYVYTCQGTWD